MSAPKINQLVERECFKIDTCKNDDDKNTIPLKKNYNQTTPTHKECDVFQIEVHTRSKDFLCY